MDQTNTPTRRTVLKTGLAAAAASVIAAPAVKAQTSPPPAKKPGSIRISAICGEDYRVRGGLAPVMSHIPNSDFWWANDYQPITPAILNDTDLLLTYYSGYMYTPENIAAIKDGITKRGMGWICVHNTTALLASAIAWTAPLLLERGRVRQELGEEARLGILPEEDLAVLASPWRRVREPRFGRADERQEYVRSALLLAVARRQQLRRSGEAIRLRQLEVLSFRTRVRRVVEGRAARLAPAADETGD